MTMEEVDSIARGDKNVVVRYHHYPLSGSISLSLTLIGFSCQLNVNLDHLIMRMWEELRMIRVYTKKRGKFPDFDEGIVLRSGATIEAVVRLKSQYLVTYTFPPFPLFFSPA